MTTTRTQARIEADEKVPMIHIYRDFAATPAQLFRAHTDPELFARWIGPRSIDTRIVEWDCRTGGSWRYVSRHEDQDLPEFYGSFHEVRENERIVQTFCWSGVPDGVALEIMTLEALPGGRSRLRGRSICPNTEARDGLLSSGMEDGMLQGYEQLDELLKTL